MYLRPLSGCRAKQFQFAQRPTSRQALLQQSMKKEVERKEMR